MALVDRRRLLTGLSVGVAASVLSSQTLASQTRPSQTQAMQTCLDEGAGLSAERFPQHAIVFDQHGRKLRFYNDLIKGKVVMIHFMSTRTDGDLQTASNIAKMQDILGDRLGRDVFLYSITVDPEHDNVDVLADYATQHHARPGWSFLTGHAEDLQSIRDALFFRPAGHIGHHGSELDCSMGLIRYGNEASGLWGSVPTQTQPEWLAERLGWILPRATDAGPKPTLPIRRGPPARHA